jgi:flagellar hook-associated protein 1 FlgK
MSFQALNSALSGLRVAQQQMSVISNNVANVGTSGYTRKVLPQSSQIIRSTGELIGVSAENVIRNVDLSLQRDLWTQVSAVSNNDTKINYLSSIESFHGTTDQEMSIAAEISDLRDSFSALADDPDDTYALRATLEQSKVVAEKINNLSDLITNLRNDTQDDMEGSIQEISKLLEQIANVNRQVKDSGNLNRSTADLQDVRDESIKKLTEQLDITYFKRGDGVIVIQTKGGVKLADETVEDIHFDPSVISATSYYPDSAEGIYVGGDPATTPGAINITSSSLGGKLGALIELRDEILPTYQAQNDELAHKMATRFEAQGLRLFTNSAGSIPADTAPTPSTTAVEYVGFGGEIQVNPLVLSDVTLLQQGTFTSDVTIPTGSNEVIRRVLDYTFGDVDYEVASGDIDVRVAGAASDLQEWLGLFSTNRVAAGINLASYPEISDASTSTNDLMQELGSYFTTYPNNDRFQITFEEARTGLGPTTVTIDLSDADTNFPIAGAVTDALDQIISEINAQITAAGVDADLAASATRNENGQLVINSRGNITLNASGFTNAMGSSAFSALGFSEDTYVTEDPYFDISVGNADPVRIEIEPGEDESDLLAKLEYDSAAGTGIPGLYADIDGTTGYLTLAPGIDDSNGGRSYGSDISIVAGPFDTSSPINATLAALPDSVNIVSALFGSYSVSGTTTTDLAAVSDVSYSSEVSNGSGTYVDFRSQYLGANASLSTSMGTVDNLIDYAQKMVSLQVQDLTLAQSEYDDDVVLQELLTKQNLDSSTVNLDEELSNLIIVQTAYSASARAMSAADEMLSEFLDSFR